MTDITTRMRYWCDQVRTRPVALAHAIPMVQEAIDEIDRLRAAPPAQPADDYSCAKCGCVERVRDDPPAQPAPAQPDTEAQEREHMGDPDKRTGIYAAPAQRLSDAISGIQEMWDMCHENGVGQILMNRWSRAISEIEAAIVPQWLPIETAPKDSKSRLVWCPARKNTFTATWHDGDWYVFGAHDLMLSDEPTHWMPLPPTPKGQP